MNARPQRESNTPEYLMHAIIQVSQAHKLSVTKIIAVECLIIFQLQDHFHFFVLYSEIHKVGEQDCTSQSCVGNVQD